MSETSQTLLRVVKLRPDAVIPFKTFESDAGLDITALYVHKKIGDRTLRYGTGIKIQVPKGYYTEIVPRSSLSNYGYMLTNCVGIIDQTYTGELFITLTKVDETENDLELPTRVCQLILRKQEYPVVQVVESLEETERGVRGFGSTGK